MITTLETMNNEQMNEEAFSHLTNDMKGVVLHSLAEEFRNEEIMAKLSLSEKELKELCKNYGIEYGFRNTERRLDGDKVISDMDIDALLQTSKMTFAEFTHYDRPSQRRIVFAFVEKTGKLTKTIRDVFNVNFFTFFTSLYYEEKALRKEKTKTKTNQVSIVSDEMLSVAPQEEATTAAVVPVSQPAWMVTDQLPTEDELYEYVKTPTESNPNHLDYLSDAWESPFGVEKQYLLQFKNQKTTKRQLKLQLRYLLDEMDELADDALLSVDFKITEHTPKK